MATRLLPRLDRGLEGGVGQAAHRLVAREEEIGDRSHVRRHGGLREARGELWPAGERVVDV
eukprot:4279854-Prymnesium_polylepis.1